MTREKNFKRNFKKKVQNKKLFHTQKDLKKHKR